MKNIKNITMTRADKKSIDFKNIENTKNVKDLDYAIQMTRWLLQPMGLWPFESSTCSSILRSISIAVCSFLLIFILIPNFLYVFLIEKDIKNRLKIAGPLSFSLMNFCKYFGILSKSRDIRACITHMAIDWRDTDDETERSLMTENTKVARLFTTICVVFMYAGGLPFAIILPRIRDAVVVENVTYRHFAYPGYYIFFNPQERRNYELVYSIHCFCGLVTFTVTSALCSIAILCILHICGQIDVISSMLQNVAGKCDAKSLGKIVEKHIRSLKFATRLENLLTGMCLVEVMGCTFNICMLGYYFLTEYEDNEQFGSLVYSMLLISFIFNTFIFCYIGNLLTERCNSLSEVAYTVDWYHLTGKEARNFMMIISSTHHPVVLTAGKLVTLSLQSFSNVLKVSFTYLNMLRTLIANTS